MNESRIAVIEGKWFSDRNQTVKSFFDFICDLHFENQHAYHYEMFNNGTAFKEILPRMSRTNNIHNVYIAAHGNNNGISGSNGEIVSATKIKNSIKSLSNNKGRLHSIYFGCCLFGSNGNLQDLLFSGNRLKWVAGYTTPIDFVDSTILDTLFWSKYISSQARTPLRKIIEVTNGLLQDAPGLVARLGFKVIIKRGKKIVDLI
jgi:hypothetical protein